MHYSHLFLIVLTVVLASCYSVPKNAITIDRYMELDRSPKLTARQFRISCSVVDAQGSVTQLPVITAKAGQEASVKQTRELIYPTRFILPHAANPSNDGRGTKSFPITPTSPTAFDTRETGDCLTLVARARGPFVEISGSFISESYTHSSRGAGEALSPITDSKRKILYTENRVTLPQFKRIETLIYVVGLPATEHKIHLDAQNSDLVVKCEVIP